MNEELIKIQNVEAEIQELKEAIKELKMNQKEDLQTVNSRIKELEGKHSKMELLATELKQDMKFYSTKILEIDGVLKEIAKEIKTISSKLIEYEVLRKVGEEQQPNEETERFMDKLLDSNNRAFLYIIITLCAIALMSVGAKVEDVTKLLLP